MWKIIIENWRLIAYTTAIIFDLIGVIFLCLIRSRLKKSNRTSKEIINENEKVSREKYVLATISETLMIIPRLIEEAEQVFTAPKSGAMKIGYVLQQVQKRFDDAHIDARSSDFLDYIESILATPEKKGEIDVSKAHETSQR